MKFEKKIRKGNFLNLADAKIILQSLKFKSEDKIDDVMIVSEETSSANDQKLFKKNPAICEILRIECFTLPELLEKFSKEINFNF